MPEREANLSNPSVSESNASASDPNESGPGPRPDSKEGKGGATATPATGGDVQAEADRLIKGFQADLGTEAAVYAVAVLANRAAAELHRLTRAEAMARKGSPDWGTWAALQNSARKLVLDSSTARDGAARLAGRPR